ncbi:MAG TPA: amidohydrolase family protein [Chryseolinea sp.]|nr:amidohydrolase family protein [Chryseolinea sp.]
MRILSIIIGCLLFLSPTQKKIPQRKIIDVHLHAQLASDYGQPPPPNPKTGKIPKWKNDQEVIDMTLATLKNNNVVKAIAQGSLSTIRNFQMADSVRFIPALDYPDKQNNPLPDTATFIRYFQEKKFLVFGELALQYEGKTLADPEFEPYLAICERMGIPVALHTGMSFPNTTYTCCPKFRTHLGNPQLIEEVLVKHPKMKIQLMHLGFPWLQETKAIMNVYPQVYADIAAISWLRPPAEFYDYLKSFIDGGFGKRIMYGSDQMAWEDAIPLSIKNVENAPFLTEGQKQDIFYNNAATFYNLK